MHPLGYGCLGGYHEHVEDQVDAGLYDDGRPAPAGETKPDTHLLEALDGLVHDADGGHVFEGLGVFRAVCGEENARHGVELVELSDLHVEVPEGDEG